MNWRQRRIVILLSRMFLGYRPWLFAAVFLGLMCFAVICGGVLFANMCDSRFRILPELSDSWIVAFDWLALRSLIVAIVFGVVMLLSPIVPLCFRKVKNAYAMFVYNLGAVFIGIFLFAVDGFMALTAGEQVGIARENLKCKDQSKRKRIPHFEQGYWEFGEGRFSLWKRNDEVPDYWLVDNRWRPVKGTGGRRWEDRVLLEDIAKWREVDGVLYLQTKTGGRQVLDCKSGKMYEYPNAQHCPRSSQSDEVFENLERRLKSSGGLGNGSR